MNQGNRRRFLQAAACAAGTAVLPWPRAFAQSGAALLLAPKQALVIGNSKYKQSPLRNPAHDAQGMAAALRKTGFAVTLGVDLSQAEMRSAIDAYAQSLIRAKAVGLFYFAGHGVQLDWRNYLLPVDAEISDVRELRESAIDVNRVVDGIRKAGNPMNLIILDACRDNPFGPQARVEQRGLSQLDAPPGTLLAYSTAPGNTAADGDGENGLYTENLLREITVPEAKVEDVFKRVRLAVRRRSHGQQIPWESTSLEEDFWFVPPKQLKQVAEAEAERAFKEELALWERVRDATEPSAVEEYLRRYPSGKYSELAQLRLDQVLAKQGERKVEVVSAPENPFTKGSARANTAYKIGDRYRFRRIDLYTKIESEGVQVVTDITENTVVFNDGRRVTDLLGNEIKSGLGGVWGPNQTAPVEFVVGKRWTTRADFQPGSPGAGRGVVTLDLQITDRTMITVPAGTFNAFFVEAKGWMQNSRTSDAWNWKRWYAPDQVRVPVAQELLVKAATGPIRQAFRMELVGFQQS